MAGNRSKLNDWATHGPEEFSAQKLPLGQLIVPEPPLVDVWFLDLGRLTRPLSVALGDTEAGADGPEGTNELSPRELRFARKFYLRTLLGAYLGIAGKDVKLDRRHRGKPVLDAAHHDSSLQFSTARSGQSFFVGVSGGNEIGVDLEVRDRRPRKVEELARRFFSHEEAASIANLPDDHRAFEFIKIWACKEAVVKSSGHGIANRFCRFSVHLGTDAIPRIQTDLDHRAEEWKLALLEPQDGFLAAVATRGSSIPLRRFVLNP